MIKKILIANRGEIACRVMATAKKMGIATVAVYSDADANSLHVEMADEAYHLGGPAAKDSYLKGDKIIDIALACGADAIHPGYGFLSENAGFAKACEQNSVIFVGPPASAIEAMGSKSAAKSIMEKAGVPLVPGYHGDNQDESFLASEIEAMGYPALIKACAGGGGKGMRVVWNKDEVQEGIAASKREGLNSFGDDSLLVEKYLTKPRHVEIQVFMDQMGNGVYLFERDCSVQRRHQKVIEEAPAPGLSEETRQQMGEAAIQAAKAINYVGAGTVEFLYDEDGSFYFMEMNTRLQVEHPVTEFITNEDLVAWQFKVASGESLPKSQDQLSIHGHAMEVRVYAEDPSNDFLPTTGKLALLQEPVQTDRVRIDTGIRQGDEVSVFYDPMISKLIVWGEDRKHCLQQLRSALGQYHILGLTTNIPFLRQLAANEAFNNEELDTRFIEKQSAQLFAEEDDQQSIQAFNLKLAILYQLLSYQANQITSDDVHSPWNQTQGMQVNLGSSLYVDLKINDEIQSFNVLEANGQHYRLSIENQDVVMSGQIVNGILVAEINDSRCKAYVFKHEDRLQVYSPKGHSQFELPSTQFGAGSDEDDGGLHAPMNGTMILVNVKAGDQVKAGDVLVIMEAMKMEHNIKAPTDGLIKEVFFAEGDMVSDGAELIAFEMES